MNLVQCWVLFRWDGLATLGSTNDPGLCEECLIVHTSYCVTKTQLLQILHDLVCVWGGCTRSSPGVVHVTLSSERCLIRVDADVMGTIPPYFLSHVCVGRVRLSPCSHSFLRPDTSFLLIIDGEAPVLSLTHLPVLSLLDGWWVCGGSCVFVRACGEAVSLHMMSQNTCAVFLLKLKLSCRSWLELYCRAERKSALTKGPLQISRAWTRCIAFRK